MRGKWHSTFDNQDYDALFTRECKADTNKVCGELREAFDISTHLTDWKGHRPSGNEWNEMLAANRGQLAHWLTELPKQLCDNDAAQQQLGEMLRTINSISSFGAHDVVAEGRAIAGIRRDLEELGGQLGCMPKTQPTPTPPPVRAGCNAGEEKSDQDKAALKQVLDGLKDAYKKVQEETENLDKAKPQPGSKALADLQLLNERLRELERVKGYFEMISAASCVPPDVLSWFRKVMDDQRNHFDPSADCNNLCSSTADWVKKMSGGTDYQKKLFNEGCMNFCGGLPHVNGGLNLRENGGENCTLRRGETSLRRQRLRAEAGSGP
jgi:hypothetical protein